MQTKLLIGSAFQVGEGAVESVLNPATGEVSDFFGGIGDLVRVEGLQQ